jgi:hypothetical protein
LFGKEDDQYNKLKWRAEYDNAVYKIYDWEDNLAAYFFPDYNIDIESDEQEDKIIESLNKMHSNIARGTLLLPMVKLGLLDNREGMDIDYVISSLVANTERASKWNMWLQSNATIFGIVGAAVYTAREDRNMLSIALQIIQTIKLRDKEVRDSLSAILGKLHQDGLL